MKKTLVLIFLELGGSCNVELIGSKSVRKLALSCVEKFRAPCHACLSSKAYHAQAQCLSESFPTAPPRLKRGGTQSAPQSAAFVVRLHVSSTTSPCAAFISAATFR